VTFHVRQPRSIDCFLCRKALFEPVSETPPVLCVVGPPKAAKSDLMSGLIEALSAKGLRVGVLKRHAHPGFEIDSEGKDSYRYYKAGAAGVAISSPDKVAFISRREAEMPLEEVVARFFSDVDIVLADGYARSPAPRIIVCTSPADEREFAGNGEVLALVDASGGGGVGTDEVGGLAEIISEHFDV